MLHSLSHSSAKLLNQVQAGFSGKTLPKLMLQAREMVADTLGY